MFSVGAAYQLPDGSVRRVVTSTSRDAPSLGDWRAWPEARAAADALAAALAAVGAPPLTGACMDEAARMKDLQQRARTGVVVMRRRVHATAGVQDATLLPSLHALPTFDRAGGADDVPDMIIMTHWFSTADGALRLTTLVRHDRAAPDTQADAELLQTVFGADARVALALQAVQGSHVWTDVALGGAGSLSSEALGSLSHAQRAALKAAQSAQLLSAVAACIEACFAGGVVLLHAAAKRGRPELGAVLDALVTKVIAKRGARGEAAPTPSSIHLRVSHGETLEQAGDFLGAAAVYKSCIDDMTRNSSIFAAAPLPSKGHRQSVPLLWSFHGLALKRAGRVAEANSAYEAGLRALAAMPLQAGRAYEVEREGLRLDLLAKLVILHCACGNKPAVSAAQDRIFEAQLAELQAAGDDSHVELHFSGGATLTGLRTRRRWAMVLPNANAPAGAARGRGLFGGLFFGEQDDARLRSMYRIVALPPAPAGWRPPLTSEILMPPSGRTFLPNEAENLQAAQHTAGSTNLPKLPKLPPARCAVCREAATKRCSACGGPFYCGTACQQQDWKAHKPACKAARAASAAAAAAEE